MKIKECKICGSQWHYQTFCPMKKKKAIKQMGKQADKWTEFRDTVAIPYLDKVFRHKCVCCGVGGKLDVDHIVEKGGHAELKYELDNLQYLCRFPCHANKTAKKECVHEEN